jgi:hypothetical protein
MKVDWVQSRECGMVASLIASLAVVLMVLTSGVWATGGMSGHEAGRINAVLLVVTVIAMAVRALSGGEWLRGIVAAALVALCLAVLLANL